MDDLDELGSLRRKPRGKTPCPNKLCKKMFSNAAVPNTCPECQFLVKEGGHKVKENIIDAKLINANIVSVRQNTAGVGTRVFVDLNEAMCSSDKCLQSRGTLDDVDKYKVNYCNHIAAAREAKEKLSYAEEVKIDLETILSKISDETLEDEMKSSSSDGFLCIYKLPGDNLAVPLLGSKVKGEAFGFLHIRELKCSVPACTKTKSKQHALVIKGVPVCRHTLLGHLLNHDNVEEVSKPGEHKIDFDLTIKDVIENIKTHFPGHQACQESNFMKNSREFVNSMISNQEILELNLKKLPEMCTHCNCTLSKWRAKKSKAFFLSMGCLKEITIDLMVCPQCKRAFYPDLYEKGLFFVHNKFLVTIEAIFDLSNLLQTSTSFIEAIKKKLLLLGQLEGIDKKVLEADLTNNANKLEKVSIAIMSLLVTGSDWDDILCYVCGNVPKITASDGNTKDSILIRRNMVYDYDDTSEVPDLQEFKLDLIIELLKNVYFQHKSQKVYNMLKLPIISAPSLIRKQINTENQKKTLMEKEFTYSKDTLSTFQELVSNKTIKIDKIGDLKLRQLTDLSKQLGLYKSRKTGELMKLDLINLSKVFLGGQGACHTYTYERGRTGGFHDLWCPHLFKISSRPQACQESVSDPSDLLQSLPKRPVCHICDDPCTLVAHTKQRYGTEAELAFGEKGGCFEMPNEDIPPTENIDCPDLTPIERDDREANRGAMMDPSHLVHPDVDTPTRYVVGTGLQMRESGTSHNRNSCKYHDLQLTKQGCKIATMTQEGMQMERKYKTIQQDRLRGFETFFLANMLQDYFHNLKKHQEQLKRFKKIEGFQRVRRDSLTHRGKAILKE